MMVATHAAKEVLSKSVGENVCAQAVVVRGGVGQHRFSRGEVGVHRAQGSW